MSRTQDSAPTTQGAHPFPPVVRWLVFPALAALWGAAGGAVAGVVFADAIPILGLALVAGLLAAGAALGAAVSRRLWVAFLVPPVVGLLALVSGISLVNQITGQLGPREPLEILKMMFRSGGPVAYLLSIVWLQAAAHLAGLTRDFPRALGAFMAAGILAVSVAGVVAPSHEKDRLLLFAFLATTFPLGGLRMSMGLAKRLYR